MNFNFAFIIFSFFFNFSLSIATHKKKYLDEFQIPYQLPSKYNFLIDYSYCNFMTDNNSCLGDYAQGIFLSLSHRMCKKIHNSFKLSYQYLCACDPLNIGCEKGNAQSLLYFLEQKGAPSNEDLPWESITSFNTSYCSKYENNQTKFYKILRESSKKLTNVDLIQKEIYLFGPISAIIYDLQTLENADNKNDEGLYKENQTVEIIGWEEKEELYWITYTEKLGQTYIKAEPDDYQMIIYSFDFYSTIE